MNFGKKTLIALVVAAGLYSYSNAVNFVSPLSDEEVTNLTKTLSNSSLQQPLYACLTPSPPELELASKSGKKYS